MSSIDDLDRSWAAGYFDGEGSVSIPLQRGRWPYLQVAVSSKDPRPVRRILKLFGGAANKDGRAGGCYRWQTQSRDAIAFLKSVRPFLSCKDLVADVGIEFELTMLTRGTRRIPAPVMEHRLRLRKLVREINERD